jgi:hypothetical protein
LPFISQEQEVFKRKEAVKKKKTSYLFRRLLSSGANCPHNRLPADGNNGLAFYYSRQSSKWDFLKQIFLMDFFFFLNDGSLSRPARRDGRAVILNQTLSWCERSPQSDGL